MRKKLNENNSQQKLNELKWSDTQKPTYFSKSKKKN